MTDRAPKEPWTIHDFIDDCRIVCPACGEEARVRHERSADNARLTCGACGHVREWRGPIASERFGADPGESQDGTVVLGAPVDPFFRCDLWLRAPCAGELLWAYNDAHVAFLQAYVAAPLRERTRDPEHEHGDRNRLLESRLPKWLIAAKNRDAVLQGLRKLAEL